MGKKVNGPLGGVSLKWTVASKNGRSFNGRSFEPVWTVMDQSKPASLLSEDRPLFKLIGVLSK